MIEKFLYKDRSYSSCIYSAYELMFTNFATIFRKTWLAAFVYSTIMSLSVFFDSWSWMQLVFLVPMVFSISWLGAAVMSLLNDKSLKHNYIYTLQTVLLMTVMMLLVSVIIIMLGTAILLLLGTNKSPESLNTTYFIFMVFFIVLALIAIIPLIYSVMKYLVESKARVWSILGEAYRNGWRHWGFIMLVFILCAIMISVLYVVIGLPRVVMYLAVQNNAYGLTIGDPSSLPKYFGMLNYIVGVVITFFVCYINVWMFFVMYYVYGRIETRIKTKQKSLDLNETAKTTVYRS